MALVIISRRISATSGIINSLAMGPEIRKNYTSERYRRIPDMAVTAGRILGIETPRATGEVMDELFITYDISEVTKKKNYILNNIYPNPFNSITTITYSLPFSTGISLNIYDIYGCKIRTLENG